MNERYYIVLHCTFCGTDLSDELEEEIEEIEEWDDDE